MNNLYRKKLEKIFNQVAKLAAKGKDNYIEYHKYIDEIINKGDYASFEEMLYIFYQIDIIDSRYVSDIRRSTWDEICFQTTSPFLVKLSKLYKQRNIFQQSFEIYSSDNNTTQTLLSNPFSATFSETGLTPSILISRVNDVFNLSLYDSTTYQVEIYTTTWDNGPTQSELIQRIEATQSFYQTQIPTSHGRDYLITTSQRDEYPNATNYSIYNYHLSVSKDPLLGQIFEVDAYSRDTKYLMQNKQYARLIGERKTYLEVVKRGITGSAIIEYDNPAYSEDQNLLYRYTLALNILQS